MDEENMQETPEDCGDEEELPPRLHQRPPISRDRRRELLVMANNIAVKFDEVVDPREQRLLRRMVDQLISI